MWNVVFRPEAERDIARATRWYRKKSGRAAENFAAAVDATVAAVLENAFLFAIVTRQSRRARVRQFPYAIYYRIAGDDVVVTACTPLPPPLPSLANGVDDDDTGSRA